MNKRNLLGALALAPLVWLSACGGSSSGDASIRLVNASPGYASLDMVINDSSNNASVASTITGVAYGSASSYEGVPSGTVYTNLVSTNSATYLLSQSRSLSTDTKYTVVAYGWQGALKSINLADDVDAADSGKTKLGVLNAGADAGTLDVYLTGTSDALDTATPVAAAVAAGAQSAYSPVIAGTYRMRVTATGSTTDVRLDVPSITLASTDVVTLVLSPGASGWLVNAIQVSQGGTVTNYANTMARVRAVAAVDSASPVSLSASGTSLITDAPSPQIGGYITVPAGSLTVSGTVGGVAIPTSVQTVAAGSDVSWMVIGNTAAPTLAVINDDNRLPTVSTNLKLRLVNAMNGMAAYPLTMTVDYSQVPSNETTLQGKSSSYATLAATTASVLQVTSSLSSTPLYSVADLALAAQGVYTVFMFGNGTVPAGNTNEPQGALRKER
jgi:hypothetical protein